MRPSIAWAGLANYRELIADRVFWLSLNNTLDLCRLRRCRARSFVGLGVALLIEAGDGAQGFYRAVYFLPVTSTLIAMAVVWEFAFHPTVGLGQPDAARSRLPTHRLAEEPERPRCSRWPCIGIWQAVGLNMVLFLAGLKAIPSDLYEAAEVDGADGAWERFRRVTWPMLGPATLFVVIVTRDPLVPGVRHRRGADPGRTQQGDRGAALHDVPGGLSVSCASAYAAAITVRVPRLRAGADAAAGDGCGNDGPTTDDAHAACRSSPWPAASLCHTVAAGAGAVVMLAPFVWMMSTR